MIKKIFLLTLCVFLMTGCLKRDKMDDINIITTSYPIEYLIDSIYGYNSNVKSIYPNGIDISKYSLTAKQVKEYSSNDMFVYNGLTNEKKFAASFLNKNKSLKLIDVSKGLSITNDVTELWLCPSNYLMLAQNIKNGLLDYINSTVIIDEVNEKYEDLKLTISKYDASLKFLADNSDTKTIIVGNDSFKFLSKYGFTVLSVQDSDNFDQNDYMTAKNRIMDKKNSYIYVLKDQELDDNIEAIIKAGAQKIEINNMINLNDEDVKNLVNYTSLMDNFIEKLKKEAYK